MRSIQLRRVLRLSCVLQLEGEGGKPTYRVPVEKMWNALKRLAASRSDSTFQHYRRMAASIR